MLWLSARDRPYGEPDLQLAIDLARRTALALENRRLYQAAQRATLARDEVLSIVAHDLRSPLGAVQVSADALSRRVPDDRRAASRREMDTVQRSIRRATRLVDDLLEVTRIEAGNLTIEVKEVSPQLIVDGVVAAFAPAAANAAVALETDVAPGVSRVAADEDRIHQALGNLVDNAIRFTPAGGRVRIVVGPDGDDLRFAVVDSGPGIPPEHLPRLFDRFWQAETRHRGAAGLGLAIAKGIVEAHGGRIWADSVPGKGSTFSFTLHASRVEPAHANGSLESAAVA
jgi:signal transduction histidine kinase